MNEPHSKNLSQDIIREGFTSVDQVVKWEMARKVVLWQLVRIFGIVRQAEKDSKR